MAHCHGPTKSRPEPSGRSRPDAARSRPDTVRNSTVERSERNKSHTNYAGWCYFPSIGTEIKWTEFS